MRETPATAARPGEELRRSPRLPYHYRQSIAPVKDDELPSLDAFREVDCENISAGGLAFRFAVRPDFKRLVVALGRPPEVTYFLAEVVRVGENGASGQRSYLVGVRFLNRVHLTV